MTAIGTKKRRVHRLAPILAGCVGAMASSCNSGGLGRADGTPGADASSCVYAGTTYAVGESFVEDCRTCSCMGTGQIACQPAICLSPDGAGTPGGDGPPVVGCTTSDEGCVYGGGILAVGESRSDGCRSYSCTAGGSLACTAEACPASDASVPAECSLPTTLVFGYYGGLDGETSNMLGMSGTLTITFAKGSCSWTLPACGTPCAVTAGTIATDLADADVQAAFAAGSGSLYGVSLIPRDVADYVVTLGDGRTIQVGGPCCRGPDMPCQPIPIGVRRLVQDLKSLVSAAAASPACKGS